MNVGTPVLNAKQVTIPRMTSDTLLTLLNVVWSLLLTGIGIEMVNNPPDHDTKKKWVYRILFFALGCAVVATTLVQSSKTATEQTAERKQHNLEQGNLEGKLDVVSKALQNSSCPSKAEIGTVVQQELAKQKYERIRAPIAEGKLSTLSSDFLAGLVPNLTNYLRRSKDNWYGESDSLEHGRHEDSEHEQWNKQKEIEHETGRWGVSRTQPEWEAQEKNTNDANRARLLQLLTDAETLRVALISKLPKESKSADDAAEITLFAKARTEVSVAQSGSVCCPGSIYQVADYLDNLAKRVSGLKTLQH